MTATIIDLEEAKAARLRPWLEVERDSDANALLITQGQSIVVVPLRLTGWLAAQLLALGDHHHDR